MTNKQVTAFYEKASKSGSFFDCDDVIYCEHCSGAFPVKQYSLPFTNKLLQRLEQHLEVCPAQAPKFKTVRGVQVLVEFHCAKCHRKVLVDSKKRDTWAHRIGEDQRVCARCK